MDAILLAFLQTRDAGESDEQRDLLAKLVVEEAAPLVRQMIRYRLHFYLTERGISHAHPDAEDLYHDILARLVRALQRLASDKSPPNIRDFRQYAQRVAANGCNDSLRLKYPQRTRLRDRIRDLLERQPEFQIWRGEDEVTLCGLAGWQDRTPMPETSIRLQKLEFDLQRFEPYRRRGEGTGQLVPILHELFGLIEGPVDLEAVVRVAAFLLEIQEAQYESLDDENGVVEFSARMVNMEDPTIERHLDEVIALRRIWKIWLTLPGHLRETFFFSFSTSRGDDLLSLLVQGGVAKPSEVARELGIPLDRLMALWKLMPMRNVDLALMWSVDRQQVNKWRFQALRMIEKRMR